MALERELATYRLHLGDLLVNEGKFVVIKDEQVLPGAFDDYEAALGAGYRAFGPAPFLVKKIQRTEPVLYFTRDL